MHQEAPNKAQERPKRGQEEPQHRFFIDFGPQNRSRIGFLILTGPLLGGSWGQDGPKVAQGRPRTPPRSILDRFLIDFGWFLDRFWIDFLMIFGT